MKYFECKPGELCKKAACCSSRETMPSLSFGDYYRLSQFTGEPMVDIWKTKGAISLAPNPDLPKGNFILSPGLLHDPCPYLSEDSRCSVYEARPMGCAAFPMFTFVNRPEAITGEIFSSYRCLQEVQLSPKQLQFYTGLDALFRKEASLDLDLWNDRLIDLADVNDYLEIFLLAVEGQKKKDPSCQSDRSKRLIASMDSMLKVKEQGSIHIIDYAFFLSPVTTCLLDSTVVKIFENLNGRHLQDYRETSEQFQDLVRKLK